MEASAVWTCSSTSMGDEALPHVFSTAEEVPFQRHPAGEAGVSWTPFKTASPDFQTEQGFTSPAASGRVADPPPSGWRIASAVSPRTPEMPFKDNANLPDGLHG